MNVNVEDAGPCRKTLRIEIPEQKVQEEYERVLNLYAKAVKIPGFRPGKAPRDIVKRRFGKEVEQEVQDRLIPQAYEKAIQDGKLDVVAILGVHDVAFGLNQPMKFSVTLDVPPQFDLPAYEGLEIKGEKNDVADKDVDDAIRDLLEQHARFDEVTERPVQKGDLVQIDYEGVCEGKPIDQLAPKAGGLGKGKDFWMMADENAFLPGFADGLLGAKPGDKRQVQSDFPADFTEKAVAGKKASYVVDVKAIREKKIPALDAKMLEGLKVESEAALKAKVREDLGKMHESMEARRRKGEVIRILLEKTKLDVPESVVQQETREAVYDIVRENSYRGVSREEIETKKDEIFQVASRNATEKVKLRYILHRIGEKEKIEATPDEVQARVAEMAARYNVTPADFRAELEKRGSMESVAEEIRANMTLDFLLGKAKIK